VVDDPAAHSKVKVRIASKYSLARLSGIPRLLNWLNRNCLLVLTYHGIYDGPKAPGRMPDTFVHVGDMEAQLKEIKRRYHIIEPDHLLESLEKGSSLPPHSALITFDDGYESFHRLAFPVLQALGINSIVFVATQYVEDQKPFYFDLAWLFVKCCSESERRSLVEWLGIDEEVLKAEGSLRTILMKMKRMLPEPRDEIAKEMEEVVARHITGPMQRLLRYFRTMKESDLVEIVKGGHDIGGHTHSHTILTNMTIERAKIEVRNNKRSLESITGRQCSFFAYPNGGESDYSKEHEKVLTEIGYAGAFTLTQSRYRYDSEATRIPRFHVAAEDDWESVCVRCACFSERSMKVLETIGIVQRDEMNGHGAIVKRGFAN
jgi:peptidoglycan/xylan/chitin deacetylase (PgdA/CDA1 family)